MKNARRRKTLSPRHLLRRLLSVGFYPSEPGCRFKVLRSCVDAETPRRILVSGIIRGNVQWRRLKASRGCKSPDDLRSVTKNQGTYVPRSPNELLKSTPLEAISAEFGAHTQDKRRIGSNRSLGSAPELPQICRISGDSGRNSRIIRDSSQPRPLRRENGK